MRLAHHASQPPWGSKSDTIKSQAVPADTYD